MALAVLTLLAGIVLLLADGPDGRRLPSRWTSPKFLPEPLPLGCRTHL